MAASSRFVYPFVRVFDSAGNALPGAWLYFYQTNSTQMIPIWQDAALSVPSANPIQADGRGEFANIFLDTIANYRVVMTDNNPNSGSGLNGAVIDTADPVAPATTGPASTTVAGLIQIATQAQHLAANTTNLATVPQYVANMIQQGYGFATAGGTGNAMTATLAPVPQAYASGMSLRLRTTAANTLAVTLNVNGLGVVAVKKRTPAGQVALIANDLLSGIEYQFDYDSAGSCFWVTEVSTLNVYALPGASGVTATNNTGTPNTKLDITADFVTTLDSNNLSRIASAVAVTIDASVVGANGLDASILGNFLAYYWYFIQKPDGTVAGLLSASSSAPTLPSGYTSKCYGGEVLTDGSAHFYRTKQFGRDIRYTVTAGGNTAALLSPTLANSQTRTAINLYNGGTAVFVPQNARKVALILSAGSTANNRLFVMPSADVGYNSTTAGLGTQPSALGFDVSLSGAVSIVTGELLLETLVVSNPTIYYTSGAGAVAGGANIQVYGWSSRAAVS